MNSEAFKSHIFSLVAGGKCDPEAALSILHNVQGLSNEDEGKEPLAIVGMSVRFPQASTIDQLWDHLVERRSLVEVIPRERFDLVVQANAALERRFAQKRNALSSDPRSYAAWLRDIEQFDPEAFGITEHEAQFMGPAERLFLQVAFESLLEAGYTQSQLRGSRTGVFTAHTPYPPFEYLKLFTDTDERAFVSNIPANLGYHLAYVLDLRGPVLTVNSSCSSSLAAIHLAKNALRQGDCDLAVVGGINIVLFPFWEEEAPDYVVRSPHYRCASYAEGADGIIGGEGVAAVTLKRLSDAIRDHDYIHAVIMGSAMSSDGTSNGIQVPNPEAQAQAIHDALNDAGVSARHISYVEGHGTGTALGDLIEVDGLTRAFRQDTIENSFCHLGSIKSNIGHLGDAAGLAGLIKTTLCLEHQLIPGIAHFQQENTKIGFAQTPFIVSGENSSWDLTSDQTKRYAGVSSIGISGTNVHVILGEFTDLKTRTNTDEQVSTPEITSAELLIRPLPILLSAASRWSLWELVQLLTDKIEKNLHWDLSDIAYTLGIRRTLDTARIGIFASSTKELLEKLTRLLQVRSFERAPEIFFAQGIFPADDIEAKNHSLTHFNLYTGSASTHDLTLMKNFLAGANVSTDYQERLTSAHLLPLPVAPFKTRRIWPSDVETVRRDVSDLFFEQRWETCPTIEAIPMLNEADQKEGLWLVLTQKNDAILVTVNRHLAEGGARTILVSPGTTFSKIHPDTYEINIHEPASYNKLFHDLGLENLSNLTGIVHGFSCKAPDKAMEHLADLEHAQDEGVFSLFNLIKAIQEHHLTHPLQLVVLSSKVEQVFTQEESIPARITTFGLARVFSQELPTVSSLAIDHDLVGTTETVAQQIYAEITHASNTNSGKKELIAYRRGQRLTKIIERQPNVFRKEITIREGGTYVIAGGTGYLGMQVGLFLSERAKVNIILLARHLLPERNTWKSILQDPQRPHDDALRYKLSSIQKIEARGSRVQVLQCDVTDPIDVTRTFAAIRYEHGSIHGTFMLVKQLYHLWLHELTLEQFKTGIYNRVRGTWLIEKEIRSSELDFFILFSSISSLMGTKSASECCAVNQFLDAMSGYLNNKHIPAYVLNLTLILDDKRDFGSKTPIPPIDFVDFQNALQHFFHNGQPWNLISRFDKEEVHFLKPVLKIPFGPAFWQEIDTFMAEHTAKNAQESLQIDQKPEEHQLTLDPASMSQHLENIWHKVLGVEYIADQANFFSCGGTSLSALRFVQLFRKSFPGLAFEVTDLYSMPTFKAQLAYCENLIAPRDSLSDLFDALENDSISAEEAFALFSKQIR